MSQPIIKPNLAIIVAMDKNNLIGRQNRLPWRIPEDLAYFRTKTLGHYVLMGKNTYLSLGKPLDQRTNIILSTDPSFKVPGCIVCPDISSALEYVGSDRCFVIGGARIFQQFLPLVAKLFLSRIDHDFEGDTYFPQLDLKQWKRKYYEQLSTKDGYQLSFNEYERNGSEQEFKTPS